MPEAPTNDLANEHTGTYLDELYRALRLEMICRTETEPRIR
jgi:hypothetical protein